MQENYELIKKRVLESCNKVSIKELNLKLNIDNVSIVGTGGSYAAAYFLTKVFSIKNIFSKVMYPRDYLYNMDTNLIAFSYSGTTPSIKKCIQKCTHNKLIISFNELSNSISYGVEQEKSFISISSTIIPITLMLKYYLNYSDKKFNTFISKILDKTYSYDIPNNVKTIEILTGDNTYTSAYNLKSSIIESGMAYPILIEKNNYAHGCSTLNYHNHTDLCIYLIGNKTNQDDNLKIALKHYKNVITLRSNYKDPIINEYILLLKSFYLLYDMALNKKIDLSNIKYAPYNKKMYYYNGEM